MSCLGKVVEKAAASLIADSLEEKGMLHPGQFGGRRKRSAIDAAATLIVQVEEAWKKKEVAGALMMDIKEAFPTVNRRCLVNKMRRMEVDENWVGWTNSY